MEHIKKQIHEHTRHLGHVKFLHEAEKLEADLLAFILEEIALALARRQVADTALIIELTHAVVEQSKSIETIKRNMITQESLNATAKNLTDAVSGAIANIGGASTPDGNVIAFQTTVQAQVDRLNQAEAPAAPVATAAIGTSTAAS